MAKILKIEKGNYRDSVTLMKVTNGVGEVPGVTQAAVAMGTPLNKKFMADVGFDQAELAKATPDDMVIVVEAVDEASLNTALTEMDGLLSSTSKTGLGAVLPRTLASALEIMPEANLAVISVPGQFAKREALQALNKGLNVFLFSSNISREDERELKGIAREKHLLMMGPDCGTAIINHTVLGFGNVVREGSIGLVSSSGTGLQEVSTLIHKAGLGISQAIGTGGGDLSDAVGGIMTMEGIRILEEDEKTDRIVLISKPPGARTTEKILEVVGRCRKPVILNFLGAHAGVDELEKYKSALTLEEAARLACQSAGRETTVAQTLPGELLAMARSQFPRFAESQRYIRGLYAGGTLCYEAQVILLPLVGDVYSNAPINPENRIEGDGPSKKNSCIDMGAEEFVVGRAHPMIDFTLRKRRILQEARDPGTGVILLDVELGQGSNPDPAAELIPVIEEAMAVATKSGRFISLVASVIGADGDFQGLDKQEIRLRDSGVLVASSNAAASRLAALIASRGKAESMILESAK